MLSAGKTVLSAERKSRWFFVLMGVVALVVAGLVALPWLLIAPAEAMRADVILHLAIDPHSDADFYVAQLYKGGLAGKIVCVSAQVACDVYPADDAARHVIDLGVRREDVLTLHLPIVDCGLENLSRIVEYVQGQGWHSALLVVNPVGSRLGRGVRRRYFGQAGVSTAVTYSPQDRQEFVHQWWRTHTKAQRMVAVVMYAVLDLLYPECR